jgi:hypothetical protein
LKTCNSCKMCSTLSIVFNEHIWIKNRHYIAVSSPASVFLNKSKTEPQCWINWRKVCYRKNTVDSLVPRCDPGTTPVF